MMSPQEFDMIYDRYKADIFRFLCFLVKDREEADDLFQEVWLRVVRTNPPREGIQNLKPWLLTVVLNLHRDALRKKRVRRLFFLSREKEQSQGRGYADRSALSSTDPVYRSEQVVLRRNIYEAIAKLPAKQRRIFLLKEVEGYQQAEIAAELGIPLGTVKSLMFRSVKRLQQELAANNSKGVNAKCDAKILSV